MNTHRILLAALFCGALALPSLAWGQTSGYALPHRFDIPNSPAVSPYLNLFNGVGDLPNYQTLVRPIIDQQSAIQRQSNAIDRIQRDVSAGTGGASGGGNPTGHTTHYLNYSHYYGTGPFTGSR